MPSLPRTVLLGRGKWPALLVACLNVLRRHPSLKVELKAAELVIRPARRRIRVAVDGEVLLMQGPLHDRIRPGALRVRVPAQRPA